MKFQPATVRLVQGQIEEAIREFVSARGYEAGKVTICYSPHQHNGPDSYAATVEVEAKTTRVALEGGHDCCATCREPVERIGGRWEHTTHAGTIANHPAVPTTSAT